MPITINSSPMTKIASSFDPSSELSFFFHPSGSKIGRSGAGILAALVYACQLQIAYWFDQAWAIVAFHFQLALFMYCSLMCWERASKKLVLLGVITGLMLPLTRPEGAIYPAVSLLVLTFRLMVPRLGAMRTLAVCLGSVMVFLLSGIYVLKQNKEIREALFSRYHVGLIYFGTQETPTELNAHATNLSNNYKTCAIRSRQDPEAVSGRHERRRPALPERLIVTAAGSGACFCSQSPSLLF